ncbi:MAG TPA: hypothetical protein VFV32_02110 [Acidimicrobiales bacterium]|nr:hypothetical protein [Acidimicrobiales bacterium]
MASRIHSIVLKRHEKVRANVDLPGVPAGTPGKVLVVSGVTWLRYRVLFENGVEHGMLDGRHIVRPNDFIPVDERVEEEAVAGDAAEAGAADAGEAAGGGDNEWGVPAHLLERAKAARQRLAG